MSSRKYRVQEKRVLAVLFDGFASLDFYGPWAVFKNACRDPETREQRVYTLHTLALHPSGKPPGLSVQSADDVSTVCQYTWDTVPEGRWDVLLIPGGLGIRPLVEDSELIKKLRLMCGRADTIATVCTGAALIAKTGLLDGSKATSNKSVWDWVTEQSDKVEWLKGARWVDTGRVFSSGGVAAGIDMAFALVARRDGPEIARTAATTIEYHWDGCADAIGWEPGQKPVSSPIKAATTSSRLGTPQK